MATFMLDTFLNETALDFLFHDRVYHHHAFLILLQPLMNVWQKDLSVVVVPCGRGMGSGVRGGGGWEKGGWEVGACSE